MQANTYTHRHRYGNDIFFACYEYNWISPSRTGKWKIFSEITINQQNHIITYIRMGTVCIACNHYTIKYILDLALFFVFHFVKLEEVCAIYIPRMLVYYEY